MADEKSTQAEPQLSCEVCMEEIPATGAYTDETDEIVRHMCGLECYARWAQRKSEPETAE